MVARRELADTFNASERKIRTALALLQKENIISIKTTNTHSIIKLTNWAFLQGSDDLATSTRPALDQHSTQEQEGKESKKEEKELKPTPDGDTLNAKVLRDYFWRMYFQKHKTEPTYEVLTWLPKKEKALVKQHGLANMQERVLNYLMDPFTQTHSYKAFLSDPDKYSKRREKLDLSQPRNKNEYAPKPRGREEIPDYMKALLKTFPTGGK